MLVGIFGGQFAVQALEHFGQFAGLLYALGGRVARNNAGFDADVGLSAHLAAGTFGNIEKANIFLA